jgi:3',5'-cyclic-AMP phosphodiesterase
MSDAEERPDAGRRAILECMAWAGTGLVWTLAGGVPAASLIGTAEAAGTTGFSFIQMSDSHIGFAKPANPDARATLKLAVDRIASLPEKPAFLIHTGDISHLSKPKEFDDADQLIGAAKLDVHHVPGEHDFIDEGNGKAYLERYGKGTRGAGWYAFDQAGVHFIGLVNVADLKAGGLGNLGADQLAWLTADLKDRPASQPIVIFSHIPLWIVYEAWGWGTQDGAQALALLKRFGSVTVLNGHIHQLMQKVEGHLTFHTAMSTAFPQPAPGTASSPGPKLVPADQLRSVLGLSSLTFARGKERLAIVDRTLAVG